MVSRCKDNQTLSKSTGCLIPTHGWLVIHLALIHIRQNRWLPALLSHQTTSVCMPVQQENPCGRAQPLATNITLLAWKLDSSKTNWTLLMLRQYANGPN
jgi:hypothetical protein